MTCVCWSLPGGHKVTLALAKVEHLRVAPTPTSSGWTLTFLKTCRSVCVCVCVCVCVRTCMCAGLATQGLCLLRTACSICVILVPVWSVGFGRAQQTVRLLRELVSVPCTLVEIPRTTKAHQQESDSSSTYWAPTMCWARLDALCMHWHLKLLQQPLWEVVNLCEMTAMIITILQMRISRQQEVKHLLAPDHTASKWWGWELSHHAL